MLTAAATLPRIFIVCALQDSKYAELICDKARGDRLPLVFDGFREGRVDEIGWQMECRRRIRSARAVVVLVSPHTSESLRAMWQVRCARELGVPVVGITVAFDTENERALGWSVGTESSMAWKWKTIVAMLTRFAGETGAPTQGADDQKPNAPGLADQDSAA